MGSVGPSATASPYRYFVRPFGCSRPYSLTLLRPVIAALTASQPDNLAGYAEGEKTMANTNNSVILKGHLGVDPTFSTTGQGHEVANIFILTNRPDYKDGAGVWHKREPQRNNVAVFLPSAIKRLKELKQGDGIEVRCSVDIAEWATKDTGEVRRAPSLVCNDRYAGHLVKNWAPERRKAKED